MKLFQKVLLYFVNWFLYIFINIHCVMGMQNGIVFMTLHVLFLSVKLNCFFSCRSRITASVNQGCAFFLRQCEFKYRFYSFISYNLHWRQWCIQNVNIVIAKWIKTLFYKKKECSALLVFHFINILCSMQIEF